MAVLAPQSINHFNDLPAGPLVPPAGLRLCKFIYPKFAADVFGYRLTYFVDLDYPPFLPLRFRFVDQSKTSQQLLDKPALTLIMFSISTVFLIQELVIQQD